MKIHIRTPSRLHFGLLSWTDAKPRAFGGAGLMIEEPHIELFVAKSKELLVSGPRSEAISEPLPERLESPPTIGHLERHRRWLAQSKGACTPPDAAILERVRSILAGREPLAVEVLSSPSEHSGLGTGTQLTMAIVAAIDLLTGGSVLLSGDRRPVRDLAIAAGRGKRSAIGVHGFEQGGFLVDGGFGPTTKLAPLVARCEFPRDWPIVLVRPKLPPGIHGPMERQAFGERSAIPDAVADRLSRLLLTGMLPALAEHDHAEFSESLYEYNHKVGECFSFAQRGAYAHARLDEIVRTTRSLGIAGVGQSSWGPTLFAICESREQGQWLCDQLFSQLSVLPNETQITFASNTGFSFGAF